MNFVGKVVFTSEDIKRLVVREIKQRFGVSVDHNKIWVGIVSQGPSDTDVHAVWNSDGRIGDVE